MAEMPVDSKDNTHTLNIPVAYDNTSDVPVKKEVDNTHAQEYNVVTDGASEISMVMEDEDVTVEHVALEFDSKVKPGDIPDKGRPYPMFLVQVIQELDIERVCNVHDATVYSDTQLPGCFVSTADDNTNPNSNYLTDKCEGSVKQKVDNMHQGLTVIHTDTRAMKIDMQVKDVKFEPTLLMECARNLNHDTEDQVTHTSFTVLLVNVKKRSMRKRVNV
jgi:hypothetical protein